MGSYQDSVKALHDDCMNKSFQLGWLKGELKSLKSIIESNKIQCDSYTMKRLEKIANSFEKSENEAILHRERVNARIEEMLTESRAKVANPVA
jgi:hypothetical protein